MEYVEGAGPIPPEYHRFLGSKTGIVSELSLTPPGRGEPQAYVSAANGPNLRVIGEGIPNDPGLRTGGKAVDPDDVLVRGIGETCERYAQWLADPSEIRSGTYEEVAREGRVVPFEYLTVQPRADEDGTRLQGTDEPALPPLSRDTTLPWTEGVDLLTGEPVALPAELVWSGVPGLCDVQSRFVGTSSGCAAGERIEDALLGGLLEVIERDGFMRTWLTRRTPLRIDPAGFPAVDRFLDEFLPDRGRSAHLFEFESSVDVPALGAAIVDDRDRRPKFVIGGSAGFDVETAALDALAETAQSWQYVNDLLAFEDPDPVGTDEPILNLDDNVLLYAQPEQFEQVSFLLEGDPSALDADRPAGASSTDAALGAVLDALDEADCTPIAVDITPPDVDEIGVSVVNVYVPELLPLTLPGLPPTEHPALADEDVSPLPHPYP